MFSLVGPFTIALGNITLGNVLLTLGMLFLILLPGDCRERGHGH